MSGTAKAKDRTGAGRMGRLLLGLVAAMALMILTALPGFSATGKIYWLTVTPNQATAGQSTDFFVTMTNKTPGNSNPNSFSVTAPSGFSVTGASISSATNPNTSATVTRVGSTVNVRSLDPVKTSQFVTLKITATASLPSGTCSRTGTWTAAVWTGSSLSGDQFALNNGGTAQQTNVVCGPNLSVTKTPQTTPISLGDDVQFDITVSNASGAGTAANVGVSDTLPAGFTWSIASQTASACSIGSSGLACTIPTLAGGSSYSVSVKAPSASAGTVTNDGVTVSLNNQTVASAGPASVVVQSPGLSITKSTSTPKVVAGNPIDYTIVVNNGGSGRATGVVATDPLPTGTGLNWGIETEDGTACTIDNTQTLTCDIGPLPAGSQYSVKVTSPTTSATAHLPMPLTNTASVTASNVSGSSDSEPVSITVWGGVLNCGDTVTAVNGVELQRGQNKDGSTCVLVDYTLTRTGDAETGTGVELLWDVDAQPSATFKVSATWDPEPNTYPLERTTQVDFGTGLHVIQWCTDTTWGQLGTLRNAIGAGDATITVDQASAPPSTPFDIVVGTERMTVTATLANGAGYDYTVQRGVYGTTAFSHDAGAAVNSTLFPINGSNTVEQACLASESSIVVSPTQVQTTSVMWLEGDILMKH